MPKSTQQICIYLPNHVVDRSDKLVAAYKKDAEEARYGPMGAFNITRSAVLRQAVVRGLAALERERIAELGEDVVTSLGDEDDVLKVGRSRGC